MEDIKCLTGRDQYCSGRVMRHWRHRLIHNSVQVFTNTSNRNVTYKKDGSILHVIHLYRSLQLLLLYLLYSILLASEMTLSSWCVTYPTSDTVFFTNSENKTDRDTTNLGTFKIMFATVQCLLLPPGKWHSKMKNVFLRLTSSDLFRKATIALVRPLHQ